ncbi:unnamed protein product [Symbiodinium sp. CCMP2592]|nr:unnamed protein product [Symbiodinium sp. CCMP2592]
MVHSRPFACCLAWAALAAAHGPALQSVEVDSRAELGPEVDYNSELEPEVDSSFDDVEPEVGRKRHRERAGRSAALLRTENRAGARGGSEDFTSDASLLDAEEAQESHGREHAEKVTKKKKKKKKKALAKKCVGTHLTSCPSDGSDPCKTKSAGNCINVFHSCGDDVLKQCGLDKKKKCTSLSGGACYLQCTGRELFGEKCESQPKERCNGGYVSDGLSGMSCMISPLEATRCIDAGTCALPEE